MKPASIIFTLLLIFTSASALAKDQILSDLEDCQFIHEHYQKEEDGRYQYEQNFAEDIYETSVLSTTFYGTKDLWLFVNSEKFLLEESEIIKKPTIQYEVLWGKYGIGDRKNTIGYIISGDIIINLFATEGNEIFTKIVDQCFR